MPVSKAALYRDASQPPQLYRLREILARGKFSKSHLYNMIARGEFPRQLTIGGLSRWDGEVEVWFADAPAWIRANAIKSAGEQA